MSRFLTYLNVPIDANTPMDVIQGGQLIDGLQMIYEDLPEGSRKDVMASTIADMAQILMRKINQLKGVTNPTVEKELQELERERDNDVKVIEERPNPVDDTDIDNVDRPIDNDSNPPPPSESTPELQDLINAIHNLNF
jgi:hypothetical protein